MANWTFEQLAAIELRGANLLVSAAAGSGKTAVLIERMTRLILQREASVDSMLVVTYTNAAAGEMRERIDKALTLAIESHPEDQKYLHDQIKRLNRSHIKTFHAFCLDVIRSHFHKLNIDPGFRMIDDTERLILMESAMDLTFEAAYETGENSFHNLVEGYSGNRDDRKLRTMVKDIFAFVLSQVHPDVWLDEQVDIYKQQTHPMYAIWENALLNLFKERLDYGMDMVDEAIAVCEQAQGPLPYKATLLLDRQAMEVLREAAEIGLLSLETATQGFKLDKIVTLKKAEKADMDEALIEMVKGYYRDKVIKKQVLQPILEFFEYKSMARYLDELSNQTDLIEKLCGLSKIFALQYGALKREKNLMDFNDLEHFAIKILEDDAVCAQYRHKFDWVFIDEYQDASAIQESIVKRISRERNVFMVGDVKQSIYKFRLADPELFLEKYKTFTSLKGLCAQHGNDLTKINQALETVPCVRIDLLHNFRSRPDVLNAVNAVFEDIMSEKLGDVDYDESAKLQGSMVFEPTYEPYVEVNLVLQEQDDEDSDQIVEQMATAEREARAIAVKIHSLIGNMLYFPKTQKTRACTFKDIVVLMRSSKSWTPTFEQVFTELGVPLYSDSRSGYFDALEIRWLVELLRIIDNPYQDLALLTVLRSPLVGADIETLIRLKRYEGFYYDKIKEHVAAIDNEEDLIVIFWNRLKRWQYDASYMPLDQFIWSVLLETDFYAYVAAMPGGTVRQANLKLLIDRAAGFKNSKLFSLSHLITFLDEMAESGGEMGIASTIGEEDDVVRLMSIHKSKGLEFPVVILAGLGRKFNLMDTYGDLILHKKWGMALSYVDLTLRTKSRSMLQTLFKEMIRIETLSEEMRVLYVGLTRAVDRLYCFASVKNIEDKMETWSRESGYVQRVHASGFIDWMMPSWLHHRLVKVETASQKVSPYVEATAENPSSMDSEGVETLNDEIHRRLNFKSKAEEHLFKPQKISVSELKRLEKDEVYDVPALVNIPRFAVQEETFGAAEMGTIVHKIFEHIDFRLDYTIADLNALCKTLALKGLLSDEALKLIAMDKIIAFLHSDLGIRVKNALSIRKEAPFVLVHNGQLIQGVIDLYFEELSGMVLVDYKTDALKGKSAHEVAEKHRQQIEYYSHAIASLTGKTVVERYVYLSDAGIPIQL